MVQFDFLCCTLFYCHWLFKTWVCFSIRVLMRSHFFWKKNKQQNQSISKILRRNISSESMWKMKGLTTLLFLVNLLVFCGTICKTVSVFSSHRIGTWKDHTEMLLEFLPKRDRWLELPFLLFQEYSVLQKTKRLFCLENWYFFSPPKKNTYHIAQNDFASRVLLSQTNEKMFCLENYLNVLWKRKNSLGRKKRATLLNWKAKVTQVLIHFFFHKSTWNPKAVSVLLFSNWGHYKEHSSFKADVAWRKRRHESI